MARAHQPTLDTTQNKEEIAQVWDALRIYIKYRGGQVQQGGQGQPGRRRGPRHARTHAGTGGGLAAGTGGGLAGVHRIIPCAAVPP